MEDLQLKIQLRATLQNMISELMVNNGFTATQIEEALNHILVQIKDAAMIEYANWAIQDKAAAMEQVSSQNDEQEKIEEE